jgi:hypothetical protein
MLERRKGDPMVWKNFHQFEVYWKDCEQRRAALQETAAALQSAVTRSVE